MSNIPPFTTPTTSGPGARPPLDSLKLAARAQPTQPRVPASKCPDCGHLHTFDDMVLTKGQDPMRWGSVLVCVGCAQVLILARNLVLEVVEDPDLRRHAAVVAERRSVISAYGLVTPDDIPPSEPAAPAVPALKWDRVTVDGVPRLFTVGCRAEGVEWLISPAEPSDELLFMIADQLWDFGLGTAGLGQPFTWTGGEYEAVFAPVPNPSGLPGGSAYWQLVWQDRTGFWPWETGHDASVLAGLDWRPAGDELLVFDVDNTTDTTDITDITDD